MMFLTGFLNFIEEVHLVPPFSSGRKQSGTRWAWAPLSGSGKPCGSSYWPTPSGGEAAWVQTQWRHFEPTSCSSPCAQSPCRETEREREINWRHISCGHGVCEFETLWSPTTIPQLLLKSSPGYTRLRMNSLAKVFKQQLHGVMVWQRQRLNQVLHVGDSQAVVLDLCMEINTKSCFHSPTRFLPHNNLIISSHSHPDTSWKDCYQTMSS